MTVPVAIRAVVDTNVVVSALVRPAGQPGQARAAWEQGKFRLILSDDLAAEMEDVLRRLPTGT